MEELRQNLDVVLACGICKNISRSEVHQLVDMIYDTYTRGNPECSGDEMCIRDSTYFITPNGLDAKETDEAGVEHVHSTTAADLARIMAYCVNLSPKRQEFLEITQTCLLYTARCV